MRPIARGLAIPLAAMAIAFGAGSARTATPLPDLIIDGTRVNPRFENRTWAANDCEVVEGCGTPGTRRLLRFDTSTRNIGTADLVLGNPAGNPLFVFFSCHGHYHFSGFASYSLRDLNNHIVAVGNKIGFCLEDGQRMDINAPAVARYTCTDQGIQWGWADIYNSTLPCQYVDVTGLPDGGYWLELVIDPDHKIPELNESNNTTRVRVEILPPCAAPPANDAFNSAQILSNTVTTVLGNNDCATTQIGEPGHAGNSGGHSVWYRWTASVSATTILSTEGSSFDTLLAVYTGGAVNTLVPVASNDDVVSGTVWSRVSFNATAGATYQIAVDGFGGARGPVVLNLNPGTNDAFANCHLLLGPAGAIAGITSSATREAGEPNHAANTGGRSIWFCWTAPASAPMTFDTLGSRFDTLLAIYTGPNVSTLTSVASNDDTGGLPTSRVAFDAVAGVAYRIAIDGRDGASGIASLNWRPVLRFTAVVRSGSLLQFNLAGAPGDRCVIETSSDFSSWQVWTRVTNSTGILTVTDPVSALASRYYRAHTE